jgi:hypothetical protein
VREIPSALSLESLRNGDFAHLNTLAARWRKAEEQIHTERASNRLVVMNLADAEGTAMRLSFPDMSGESFREMWEDRECDAELAEVLRSDSGILLFVHANTIKHPVWVTDVVEQMRALGLPVVEGKPIEWHPRTAPTQVQLVEMLQLIRKSPLNIGKRKLAVMLSAWDKVEEEGHSPENFLALNLPLLDQYLRFGPDEWTWRTYGVSAQGGDLDDAADELRAADVPSTRIKLVLNDTVSHDLTEPLRWLTAP